ncbi:hypothetical protein KFE25_010900 [Diacronema lutheri]|uniref:PA domain-containing protein n=1 Tax=Diacronema lutheri TaxID=2081491 RepID=A0A8J5XDQ2_DIALT|nr:hypothetical protein KFE25_010900 [Diacronema lutheri]
MLRAAVLAALVGSCPESASRDHYLYCKHCGAPLIACDQLEYIPSHIAQRTVLGDVCGGLIRLDVVPHALGAARLLVHSEPALELEASGANFVHFPSLRGNAHGELRVAEPFDACRPLVDEVEPTHATHAGWPQGDEAQQATDTSDGAHGSAHGGRWRGALLLARRGNCTFHDKALHAQRAGVAGVLIVDTESGPVAGFTMSGPEPHESGVVVPVAIVAKDAGDEVLALVAAARRRGGRGVRATLDGFAREFVTGAHSHGLALEMLPGTAAEAQRRSSWYEGANFRHSRCRVCNTHVGYFFNGSAEDVADVVADADEREADGRARLGSAGSARSNRSPVARPLVYHALLRDEVADSRGLRSMTAKLRVAPVL